MPDHLESLAKAARAVYVFHRRQQESRATGCRSLYGAGTIPMWDGGRDRKSGKRYADPIWPKVVRISLVHGADLADYIACQFDPAGSRPVPRPNQLISAAAVERYRASRHDGAAQAGRELMQQRAQFTLACAMAERLFMRGELASARIALRDRQADLLPLFRHCVAARLGEDAIAAEFREAALARFLMAPANYRVAWREMLPGGFLGEADAAIAAMMGEVGGGR